MHDRITQLLAEATTEVWGNSQYNGAPEFEGYVVDQDKFASLIIAEVVAQINQEWYDLNNVQKVEGEDARAIGIRVGQKNGVLKALHRIQKYFGADE